MKKNPLISVIMPSLNQAAYLEAAMLSVLDQDYPYAELIVIDGASNDGSLDIIQKHKARLKYWVSEPDSGQSEAINKGRHHASGEIITWLNSDDLYRPGTLSTVAQFFTENAGVSLLHGQADLFGKGRIRKIIGPETTLQPHQYLPIMRFPQPASFFERSSFLPLDPALHYAMDFDLVARTVLLGKKIGCMRAVLADYRLHAASKSIDEAQFMSDWTSVLFNVFNSLPAGETFVEKLQNAAGYRPAAVQKLPCVITLTRAQLNEVFLEHLHFRFHHFYRLFDYQKCLSLYELINSEDPDEARSRSYKKYLRRLKYLRPLLKLKSIQ